MFIFNDLLPLELVTSSKLVFSFNNKHLCRNGRIDLLILFTANNNCESLVWSEIVERKKALVQQQLIKVIVYKCCVKSCSFDHDFSVSKSQVFDFTSVINDICLFNSPCGFIQLSCCEK